MIKGCEGGGILTLEVDHILHVDGLISSNGGGGGDVSGGGSGGSILAHSLYLEGSGIIRVNFTNQ